jgi:hypothetical protein
MPDTLDGGELLGAPKRQRRRLAVDLSHETAQHTARAHLNIRCDALRRKAADDRLPANRRRDLRNQRLDRGRRRSLGLGIDVGDNRHSGIRGSQRAQLRREPLFGGLHQRAVERRAHRQRNDAFCAERLRPVGRARDGVARAGNHHLAASVEVGGRDNVALGGVGTRVRDLFGIEAEDGGHRAGAHRHRLLHVAAASAHERDGVPEGEGAGGNVRRVFAQAVAGDEGGTNPLRCEQIRGGDARGENGRLSVLGQHQPIFGTVEAQAAQRLAERGVGLGKRVATDGEDIGERLPHPDRLRALSREEKRDHQVAGVLLTAAAAAMSRSTRPMSPAAANR